MPATIDVDELPAEVRQQLGIPPNGRRGERRRSLTKDEIRSAAIRVLGVVSSLTKDQRRRVLEHALRVNDV